MPIEPSAEERAKEALKPFWGYEATYQECLKKTIAAIQYAERDTANRIWEAAAKIVEPIENCVGTDYEKQAYDLRTVLADKLRSRISRVAELEGKP